MPEQIFLLMDLSVMIEYDGIQQPDTHHLHQSIGVPGNYTILATNMTHAER